MDFTTGMSSDGGCGGLFAILCEECIGQIVISIVPQMYKAICNLIGRNGAEKRESLVDSSDDAVDDEVSEQQAIHLN